MTLTSSIATSDPVARLAELLPPGVELPGDGRHLPECPQHATVSEAPCDWCRWALATPDLAQILDVAHDARALRTGGHVDSVPAAVAFHRLREIHDSFTVEPNAVGSARRLIELAHQAAGTELEHLERQIAAASRAGGPIEAACLHTAGGLAAVALTDNHPTVTGVDIPSSLRGDLERLASTMSARLQLAAFLPIAERLHHRQLPRLLTQPEWDRRPDPSHRAQRDRLDQLHDAGLVPGSLEELVVESMLDEHLELLVSLGGGIAELGPLVRLSRPLSERTHPGRTRELLWRVARIDWHLSFVDTGLAACWDTHVDQHTRQTDVPWVVASAITLCRNAGFTSALQPDGPNPIDAPVD